MHFRKILGLNGAWLPDSGKETRIGIWMDPENKPNKQGTRIGGGYMVVVYGSGGGSGGSIWIWIGGGIWTWIGSGGR